MKKVVNRVVALLLTFLIIFAANPAIVLSWDQSPKFNTHQAINRLALRLFINEYAANSKYINSPIDMDKSFSGPVVTSNSMLEGNHTVELGLKKFEDWVIHGGYSADEPNLWASVRHFYNPLPNVGPPQLTDQVVLHGNYRPAISARYWAFTDPTNPYGWKKALDYYKKSMEIAADDNTKVIPGMGFRDPDIGVNSPGEERSAYLGKAFRSLGETMHMMADMTQPAHTRNDSHPLGDTDPLEDSITDSDVWVVSDIPVEAAIKSKIDSAAGAEDIYEKIALFTNSNFYSDDTIYDKAAGVNPWNGENPFPSPQFKDLSSLESLNSQLTAKNIPSAYLRYFNNRLVPMIQQTYASYLSGGKWVDYHIPNYFSRDQAAVLIPIAIKANSKLVNLFFPTMELTIEVEKPSVSEENDPGYKEYKIKSSMKHLIEQDTEWRLQGVKAIEYSGPAELWSERLGKLADNIQFSRGSLKKSLVLYTGQSINAGTNPQAADKFQVEDGDTIYLVIKAGGRTFKSNKYTIASCRITIQPEFINAEKGIAYTFMARPGAVPSNPFYTWKVDGRETQQGPNNALSVTFRGEGYSTVSVTLRDGGKECAATAKVTISSAVQPPLPPPPSPSSFAITSIIAEVNQTSYTAVCPQTVNAQAAITANSAGTATYVWERSDGTATRPQTVNFFEPGSVTVDDSWQVTAAGSYWLCVHILTPVDTRSNQVNFTVRCTDTETADFTGTWDPSSSGAWGTYGQFMRLTQSGNQVTGTYDYEHGTIKGMVSGRTMTGTWAEEPSYGPPNDAGPIKMTMALDGKSFTGSWEYDRPEGGGGWIGAKKVQ